MRENFLHRNKALAHTALRTNVLEMTPVKLLIHPLYSPDMELCNFCLFQSKDKIRGKMFETSEAVREFKRKLKRYRKKNVKL